MSTNNAVQSQAGGEGETRRGFHVIVLNILGALVTAAIALPTIVYLLFPPKARGGGAFIDAGDISGLTPGLPVEMSFQKTGLDGWRLVTEKKTAWVVKTGDNQITAFGPQCTHLGCAYHWENNQFICPCHTSYFSIDGKVTGGPAPRPLDRYVTRIDGTRLQVGELKQIQA
jgi:menaquinol-cytochrome c reductase iron-sulfur subunit